MNVQDYCHQAYICGFTMQSYIYILLVHFPCKSEADKYLIHHNTPCGHRKKPNGFWISRPCRWDFQCSLPEEVRRRDDLDQRSV